MIVAVLTHTSDQFPKLLSCMSLARSSSFRGHLLAIQMQKKPWNLGQGISYDSKTENLQK